MISIRDIARESGVSIATVSRVLNNKSASAKTKRKVINVVQKLGYIPNARAADLKNKKTKSIGIIIPNITNPVYPVGVQTIYDTARQRGYHLILGNNYNRVDEELKNLQMMARERVAGLILGTCEVDDSECDPYINNMLELGICVVFAGRNQNDLKVDEVMVDGTQGVYKAVCYLLKIGRKKIAFIAGNRGTLSTESRLAGYLKALSERGVVQDEKLLSFGGWTKESGQKQMEKLLNSGEKIDAVFCGNDLLAIGSIQAIEKVGLKVPDDIGVVGFDDIELASLVRPKLTTVSQPQEKIASIVCNLLLDRIEGKEKGDPKEILIEPELIIRESA